MVSVEYFQLFLFLSNSLIFKRIVDFNVEYIWRWQMSKLLILMIIQIKSWFLMGNNKFSSFTKDVIVNWTRSSEYLKMKNVRYWICIFYLTIFTSQKWHERLLKFILFQKPCGVHPCSHISQNIYHRKVRSFIWLDSKEKFKIKPRKSNMK